MSLQPRPCRRVAIAAVVALVAASLADLVRGAETEQWRWSDVERIVAFGDVHGAYHALVELLQETGVIDGELRWSAGKTHVVSLGDLVDRGPDSRKVMEFLMRLQDEAAAAGGRMHVVLGNHESMNMTGELDYVSAEEFAAFAAEDPPGLRARELERFLARFANDPTVAIPALTEEFAKRFPPGYFGHHAAFGPTGRYGRWLLAQPFVIVVNDTAFTHGGLPQLVSQQAPGTLNAQLRGDLRAYTETWRGLLDDGIVPFGTDFTKRVEAGRTALPVPEIATDQMPGEEPEAADTPASADLVLEALLARLDALDRLSDAPVLNATGPTWYRGTAYCNPLAEVATTQAALERLGAQRVVVGHTPTSSARVTVRMFDRVLMADTGMLREVYAGRPSAVIIEGGRVQVYYADEDAVAAPVSEPRRIGARPGGITDDELERILREGEIVAVEDVGVGVTQPRRLTIRSGEIEVRAIFHTVATPLPEGRRASSRLINKSDHFQFNVAAYRLDRMLALNMVPVTVLRTVEGEKGSLQFWIENSINHLDKVTQGIPATGFCSLADQYALMYVFDTLIYNEDRTQQNMLYTRDDWMLWLIDHTRAFRTHRGRPEDIRRLELRFSNELAARLEALDQSNLGAALGDLLNAKQIGALLKRRDEILEDWRETR